MKTKIVHYILTAVFSISLFSFFLYAVGEGLDRSIVVECNKLQKQSLEYELFWLTENQKEMCDGIGIRIVAPVGSPYEEK